jgi:L-alanine-DL-glutamate epimerase-like enolase superfamily enzyme
MSRSTIRTIRFASARSALSRPIADATHAIPEIRFVVATLELDNGVTGQSHLLAFHYSPHAIAGACRDLEAFLRGRDVAHTERVIRDWDAESEYFGQSGINRWALGLANIAMWDARGKLADTPVWKLLGGSAKPIPVYGSGGWLSYSDDELVDEVTGYVKRGFAAVKVKVGAKDPSRDLERLRRVRDAVGPRVRVMMDANQGLSVDAALELALAAREFDIGWFEEPIDHTDFDGYATLRERAGVAIAMGEREYDLVPLRELARRKAIDLWQPDLMRLGSVEAWRASASLAQSHGIPVLPHYYRDYDVPLLCTIPNGAGAESFDWIDAIVDRPLRVENGFAYPREEAGWGFAIREEVLQPL